MSDNTWTDADLTDILGDPSGDNSTIRLLREKIKADGTAMKQMREQIETLTNMNRGTIVGDALKSAGLNPNAEKLYKGEVNPTAVQAWVEENKEFLAPVQTAVPQVTQVVDPEADGTAAGAPAQGTAPPVFTPDTQAAFQRMVTAGVDGVPGSNFNDAMGSMQNAQSMEELLSAISQYS